MTNLFVAERGVRPRAWQLALSYLLVAAALVGFFWLSLSMVGVALDFSFVAEYHARILDGLALTLEISVGSLMLSLAIGLPVAVVSVTEKLRLLSKRVSFHSLPA